MSGFAAPARAPVRDPAPAAPRRGGRPLPAAVRADLEPRYGHDFRQVRVHTDGAAAASAAALGAAAYTAGPHIVFGAGRYDPHGSAGRRLLTHELAHVVQQDGQSATGRYRLAPPDPTTEHQADTAAAAVARGDPAGRLTPAPAGTILRSPDTEADERVDAVPEPEATSSPEADDDGPPGGAEAADQSGGGAAGGGRQWSALGIVRELGGDRHVVGSLLRLRYRILSFRTAYDRWRYHADGRTEEVELTGLRGNTCREQGTFCPRPREIRIRESLPVAAATTTYYHESQHAILGQPRAPETGRDQEIEVRVRTEQHLIRRSLPPTAPGYRRPDGTVDRAFIRRQIESSPHYSPRGRTRIGRRYVGEQVVRGWRRALRVLRRQGGRP